MQAFILERFAGYLREQGFSTLQVDAVLSQSPTRLDVVPQQLEAVKAFQALPEAESLAAANKRVANILKQAQAKGESFNKTRAQDAEGARGARAVYGAWSSRRVTQCLCTSAATTPAT